MENNDSYEVETDLEVFRETLEALEKKYSVAKVFIFRVETPKFNRNF